MTIPRNDLSTLSLDDVGRGWRRLSIDEPIRAWCQAYVLSPKPQWKLSCFVLADGYSVSGRTHYRSPASIRAWCTVLIPLIKKLSKRWWTAIRGRPS